MEAKLRKWFRQEVTRCLSVHLGLTSVTTATGRSTLDGGNRQMILTTAHRLALQYKPEALVADNALTPGAIETVVDVWLKLTKRAKRPTWDENEVRRILSQFILGLSPGEISQVTSTSLTFPEIIQITQLAVQFAAGKTPDQIKPESPLLEEAIGLVHASWIVAGGTITIEAPVT